MTMYKDQLYQWGGVPVGAPRFYGWWGEDTWFVDYDNGGDAIGKVGKTPTSAIKHLADAISNANKWDTIYLRPRDAGTTDPGQITPATATNWVIPNAKHGMSIIGAGPVLGHANSCINLTHLRGHASVTSGAVLDIRAPGTCVENIHFHDGAVAIGAGMYQSAVVRFAGATVNSSYQSYGSGISNCMFRWTTPGAIVNIDNWFISIDDCWFENCDYGIIGRGINTPIHNQCVRNCVFTGTAGNICCNVVTYSGGAPRGVTFDQIIFNCPQPTKTATLGVTSGYFYEYDSGAMCWSRCYSISDNMVSGTEYTKATGTYLPGCIDGSGNNWGVT